MKHAMFVLLLAACGDSGALDFKPVIEGPKADDPDALAFTVIDELDLSVANEGDTGDIVSNRFIPGQDVSLVGVPFGDHLVMHANGARSDVSVAYGRTCAFSLAADEEAPAPHLFFSRTAKFATFTASDGAHTDKDATPLARQDGLGLSFLGNAIFLGGTNSGATVPESYDPQRGSLSRMFNIRQRLGAVAALFGNATQPKILLVGGTDTASGSSQTVNYYEIIDPSATSDQVVADAHFSKYGLTATTLADGRVVIIGGDTNFDPASGDIYEATLVDIDVAINKRATLVHPRTGHTATPLGESIGAPVLIAGGTDGASATPVDVAELYKPLQGALASPATFAPVMRHPRSLHQAVRMADDSVVFIGGIDANGQPVRALERFTLEEGFTDLIDETKQPVSLPATFGVVGMTVTKLPDDRVLITGGKSDGSGPALSTAVLLRLDPLAGTIDVVPTDSLQFARTGHQAVLLCDGTVLISGGSATGLDLERYNPPANGRR